MNCPACNSDSAVILGSLGSNNWVRCEDCGTDYVMTEDILNSIDPAEWSD